MKDMKRARVTVLMSTYNGERFLREQLDSVLAQDGVDVRLMVRDDGSKDGTLEILEEYAAKYRNIGITRGENMGFVRSFSALVRMALEDSFFSPSLEGGGEADFYAFADQDDIWMAEKLKTATDALQNKDAAKPNLYTCNSMQIDADGKETELFHKGPEPKFRRGNVLMFGTEQGCSMVFNRRAMELYAAREPQLTWHDRWMYHICYFLGTATYDHRPWFYYRRHESNALANHHVPSLAGVKSKAVRVYRILLKEPPTTQHVEMAKEFYEQFGSSLNEEDRKLFRRFMVCRDSVISKVYMLFSRKFIYPYYDVNEGRMLKWLIMSGRL